MNIKLKMDYEIGGGMRKVPSIFLNMIKKRILYNYNKNNLPGSVFVVWIREKRILKI